MPMEWKINLLLFDGAAGAGAAPAAGGEGGGEAAAVAPGTLDDGTVVDNRLAARMEKQAQKKRERGETVTAAAPVSELPSEAQAEEPEPQESVEDRWHQLKKGEFKEQYARDVQAAVRERFKNQEDANEQIRAMQPMLDALMKKAGVETIEELSDIVLDDDSLYEDEAEEAGMTVAAYKQFKALQDEHQALKAREEEEERDRELRQHFDSLVRQAEAMKERFPDFDLRTELENETFRRLTAPNSGLSLESAFYAVHHNELAPQAMAYGIQHAKEQISKTMQANSRRPNEGAMQGSQSFDVSIDPRNMTRQEREQLKQRARRGERIVF